MGLDLPAMAANAEPVAEPEPVEAMQDAYGGMAAKAPSLSEAVAASSGTPEASRPPWHGQIPSNTRLKRKLEQSMEGLGIPIPRPPPVQAAPLMPESNNVPAPPMASPPMVPLLQHQVPIMQPHTMMQPMQSFMTNMQVPVEMVMQPAMGQSPMAQTQFSQPTMVAASCGSMPMAFGHVAQPHHVQQVAMSPPPMPPPPTPAMSTSASRQRADLFKPGPHVQAKTRPDSVHGTPPTPKGTVSTKKEPILVDDTEEEWGNWKASDQWWSGYSDSSASSSYWRQCQNEQHGHWSEKWEDDDEDDYGMNDDKSSLTSGFMEAKKDQLWDPDLPKGWMMKTVFLSHAYNKGDWSRCDALIKKYLGQYLVIYLIAKHFEIVICCLLNIYIFLNFEFVLNSGTWAVISFVIV